MSSAPFIVLSLPRSRSAWMSHFLRYGGASVGHDLATRCSSVAEFRAGLAQLAGTCETGAVLGWRLIREEIPEAKLVVIRRSPIEVYQSLLQFGITADMDDLVKKHELLKLVSALPGTLTVNYWDLRHAEVCQQIFELCLDLPFDWVWWEELDRTNIQVNMGLRLQQLIRSRDKIELFKAEVASRTQALGNHHSCLH